MRTLLVPKPPLGRSPGVSCPSPQEWSEELGRLAGARAASCLEGPAPPPAPQLGWSEVLLPAGTGGFGVVLELWFAEGQRYDFRTGRCAGNATCRHYTQVGRRDTGGLLGTGPGDKRSPTAGVGHGRAAGLRPAPLPRPPRAQRGLRLRLLTRVRGRVGQGRGGCGREGRGLWGWAGMGGVGGVSTGCVQVLSYGMCGRGGGGACPGGGWGCALEVGGAWKCK